MFGNFLPSSQDQAVYFRSLGAMFESGIQLPRALDLLSTQTENAQLRRTSASLCTAISSGKSISKAMAAHPLIFTDVQRRLVQAGESGGRLSLVLRRIADYEEQRTKLQQKVKSSLVTPVMVCFVCLAVAIILPPLCLRSMLAMLKDSGVALPWPTKVLMAVSALSSSIWFYLGLVFLAVGGWFAWRKAMENQEIRRSFWQLLLSLPVLSDLLTMIGVIRFGQTFSSLLDSGHNLLATVNLAAQSSGDPVLEANIPKAIERLKEGESLASSLAAAEYFPRSFLQSLKAGEEAGSPSQIVNSMLSMYNVDLDYRLTVFTNSLEPLFMLAIGAVVGFVSVAALLPMLKLVETL